MSDSALYFVTTSLALAAMFIVLSLTNLIVLENYPTCIRGTSYGFTKLTSGVLLTLISTLYGGSLFFAVVMLASMFAVAAGTCLLLPDKTQEAMNEELVRPIELPGTQL